MPKSFLNSASLPLTTITFQAPEIGRKTTAPQRSFDAQLELKFTSSRGEVECYRDTAAAADDQVPVQGHF